MQTCYNCGKQVSDETLICPECGALVRRYNDIPPRTNAQPQTQPMAPAVNPVPSGNIRFQGGIKVWLILMIVLSAYLCLNTALSLLVLNNSDAMLSPLSEPGMEEFSDLAEDLSDMLEVASEALPLFYALGLLYAGKLVCHIWLLKTQKKKAFYVSIGVSLAAMLGILILGGSLLAVVYFMDPLVTWVNLRRYWPIME